MTSAFDATASSFERWRPLPGNAAEAIRSAIRTAVDLPERARVLDIGAGTGRIGKAFLAAGDFYVGVDSSLAMLQEFSAKAEFRSSRTCCLLQADGQQLPFQNGVFDLVLLMQVLSSAGNWRQVLNESKRVLRPRGVVSVGHMMSPETGVDAQLKRRLAAILEEMRVSWHRPKESLRQALAWLESAAPRHVHRQAIAWNVTTTADEFLVRHRTGARFAALPSAVQDEALARLRSWAEKTLGPVDTPFEEHRSFELDIFKL